MDWKKTLETLAPTVATALLGPLGGPAVAAIGAAFGLDKPTQDSIAKAITSGQMTPEQVGKLKELELQYQRDEEERGFRYAELAFKDRDSARQANTAGGVQKPLFAMSVFLLALTLGTEVTVLWHGLPPGLDSMVAGRVLGLMDSVALLILGYYYGTSNGSEQKTALLAQVPPVK